MADVFNYLVVLIGSLVILVLLGLIAGFSPTLYIAQVTVGTKAKKYLGFTAALMTGVLLAIIVLLILFQTFHLNTLISLIDQTVDAIKVSVIFNLIVGLALILGGFYYIRHQKMPRPKLPLKKAGGIVGIFGLGFVRTFISVSGLTATYLAGNLIADVTETIPGRILHSLVFLAATILPFAVIIFFLKKHPDFITTQADRLRALLHRINYRLFMGVAALLLGGCITIFHIMIALFY
jgi:hypothetical protein